MSSVEKLLLQMSLREPSEELDQRVGTSVAGAPMRQSRRRRPSWWVLLSACGACLLVGVIAGRQWPLKPGGAVAGERVRTPTESPAATEAEVEADESTAVSARAVASDVPPAVERSSDAAEVIPGDRTIVSEGTFLLINGRPVRRHRTFSTRRVRVYNMETDQFSEIDVPIRRDVVISSCGI